MNTSLSLLLLSNSTLADQGYLEFALPIIKKFIPNIENGLFIPYAAVGFSYKTYSSKVNEAFQKIDLKADNIDDFEDKITAINQSQCIIIGGGNTFRLLERLYHFDLITAIKNKVDAGTPYIGWSAGSNLASPGIFTSNDMPIIMPASFNALGFVNFQINPHYNNAQPRDHKGETRNQRIEEYIALNPEKEVYGLPEGTFIELKEGQVKFDGLKDGIRFDANGNYILKRGLLN